MFKKADYPVTPRKIGAGGFYCSIGQKFSIGISGESVQIVVTDFVLDEKAYKDGVVRYSILVDVVGNALPLSVCWKEMINGILLEHDLSEKIQ